MHLYSNRDANTPEIETIYGGNKSSYWILRMWSAHRMRERQGSTLTSFSVRLQSWLVPDSSLRWLRRTLLIKVAAEVRVSSRRILVRLSRSWPYLDWYERVCRYLESLRPLPAG